MSEGLLILKKKFLDTIVGTVIKALINWGLSQVKGKKYSELVRQRTVTRTTTNTITITEKTVTRKK